MYDAIYNAVIEWNRNATDREKLQHVYIFLIIGSLVVAGLVSLLDPVTGQDLLIVPLAGGFVFVVNTVVWSLLDSTILSRLSGRRKKS